MLDNPAPTQTCGCQIKGTEIYIHMVLCLYVCAHIRVCVVGREREDDMTANIRDLPCGTWISIIAINFNIN